MYQNYFPRLAKSNYPRLAKSNYGSIPFPFLQALDQVTCLIGDVIIRIY